MGNNQGLAMATIEEVHRAAEQPIRNTDEGIVAVKQLRADLDPLIDRVRQLMLPLGIGAAEKTLAQRRLQEGMASLGFTLKELGNPNPYPNSKDPSNTIVDPTDSGLKM